MWEDHGLDSKSIENREFANMALKDERDLNSKFRLKFTMDKVFALLAGILFSPIITFICLSIWIEGLFCRESRGPVLHKEERISQGKRFCLLKFRVLKTSVSREMTETDSATFLQFETENTTWTGKLLIKFYLDEVPQFFHIFLGQMSFVGPRPRIPSVYEEDLQDGFTALKYLRGSITGPHQLAKGIENNPRYLSEKYLGQCRVYTPSKLLRYDLSVMVKTIFKNLKGEGL